jgi:hypothetical protein
MAAKGNGRDSCKRRHDFTSVVASVSETACMVRMVPWFFPCGGMFPFKFYKQHEVCILKDRTLVFLLSVQPDKFITVWQEVVKK